MKNSFLGGLFVLLYAVAAFGSAAAGPTDTLRGPLDQAVIILQDSKYQTDDPGLKAEQRDKIWGIISETFDFTEVSRRALARNWKTFSPEQQKEFSSVFSKMLGNIYVDRIQSGFADQRVEFADEILHDSKPLAIVKTFILSDQNKMPVDYSLKKKDGRWWVYDVKVEGVSLVKNYRTQFNDILRKDKPDQLIERLKKKVAEQEAELKQG
ncbi:MAG: ABC transporter substrate-binding protein [Desulfosarcina sp.]|nr:ABC transporter substrate-binding protein [Desulfobacterales bacterium]